MTPQPVLELDKGISAFEALTANEAMYTVRLADGRDKVIMDASVFAQMQDDGYLNEALASVRQGLEEIERGEGLDAWDVSRELRARYGL